jgi:hypothetical protein
MGFLRRRSREAAGHGSPTGDGPTRPAWMIDGMTVALHDGHETLRVVGESFFQENLWAIVGGHTDEYVRHSVIAVLVAEDGNQYDANAISVWVSGLIVGHFLRGDAADYRPGLVALQAGERKPIALEGVIAGGGHRDDGIGMLGVFLSHDPGDFGLARSDAHSPGVRTGLTSEAAHGHLGWLAGVPDDDLAAITELRGLLEHQRDPIDRHFIHTELEKRLYRCRAVFTSALDDYDVACGAHDSEMGAIRTALVAELGHVPLLETYRQMAIRQQKAKQWSEAICWAERGIALYGDEAVQQEWVDDLQKRVDYCTAKLRAPSTERPTSVTSVPSSVQEGAFVHADVERESLLCASCGGTFERFRTRGRKPRQCPDCRS